MCLIAAKMFLYLLLYVILSLRRRFAKPLKRSAMLVSAWTDLVAVKDLQYSVLVSGPAPFSA